MGCHVVEGQGRIEEELVIIIADAPPTLGDDEKGWVNLNA